MHICPASWPDYSALLAELDDLPAMRTTLLVVPDFHRQGSIDADSVFCHSLEQRLQRGGELVVQGYFHEYDSAPPQGPAEWFRRRILTQAGEFAATSRSEARGKIEAGMQLIEA